MYQYAQLIHWLPQRDSVLLPPSVDIDLTNVCNQDCYYCDSAEFRQQFKGQQTLEDYIELIDRLASWRSLPRVTGSLNTICFSGGGEPTLFKGYERIVEHSLRRGFRTSMTTNGTNLHRLIDHVDHDLLRTMAWIGVDVDAGTEALYEQIRRTRHRSIFQQVSHNIKALTNCGVNVDLKILLNEHNANELEPMFAMAQNLGVRMIYFRPTVINNTAYDCRPLEQTIKELAHRYCVNYRLNLKKFEPRTYNRCHQMYQFAIFSPDGNIYSCCENKGNPRFALGSWINGDFRDLWMSDQHHRLYNSINTQLCQPCRSHNHNVAIENIIQNPELLDTLFY